MPSFGFNSFRSPHLSPADPLFMKLMKDGLKLMQDVGPSAAERGSRKE